VRAIAGYKTVKGALQLAGGALLFALLPFGLAPWMHHAAQALRDHVTRAAGVWMAERLLRHTSVGGLEVLGAALCLDGVLTSVEGWALRRGYPWGEWLVVVATGALIPFEARAFWRRPHLFPLVVLALNLAIVVYLGHRVWRQRRAHERPRR
jgi:uncharacterized membrane protein (DUF2068 family)